MGNIFSALSRLLNQDEETTSFRGAKKYFSSHMKRLGMKLTALAPEAGIEAMLSFYRDIRARDCRMEDDGDMLLYQWGTHDWGEGKHFEIDITRQLCLAGGRDDEGMRQLHLTFKFAPTTALKKVGAGNRWCKNLAGIDGFRNYIRRNEAYRVLCKRSPGEIILDLDGV